MASDSSNDVSIFAGILAGVAVVLMIGVIGLVGAGFLWFRAKARAIPVPTSGPTTTATAPKSVETAHVVSETPTHEPVVAPVPAMISGDDPVIAPIPVAAE